MAFTSSITRRAAEALLAAALLGIAAGAPAAGACSGTVYLTFDTGNMAQAEAVAAVLRRQQVRATFFVANEKTRRGDRALDPGWRDYWRALAADGHRFGNHTWRHLYARRDLDSGRVLAFGPDGAEHRLDEDGYCAELRQADDAFHALTGQRLDRMWRAPGGRTTPNTLRWAARCGFPVHVGWDEAGVLGDELPSDAHPNERLLKRALAGIGPNTVTLMHLGVWSRKEPIAPILEPLIQGLKARGLCFAPLAPVPVPG